MKFKLIVCGSRTFKDFKLIYAMLDTLMIDKNRQLIVITGDSSGADALAITWAKARKISYQVYFADWERLGKAAGPLRNQEIVDAGADLCAAFWDGRSPGTKDMVTKCEKAGIVKKIIHC